MKSDPQVSNETHVGAFITWSGEKVLARRVWSIRTPLSTLASLSPAKTTTTSRHVELGAFHLGECLFLFWGQEV